MNVRVRLFAVARQLIGAAEVQVALPAEATVGQLRAALSARYPQAALVLQESLIAVDTQYAADATPVAADSEIAVIPPVSGG